MSDQPARKPDYSIEDWWSGKDWWCDLVLMCKHRAVDYAKLLPEVEDALRACFEPIGTEVERAELDEELKLAHYQFNSPTWIMPLVMELEKQSDLRHLIPYVAHGVTLMRKTLFEECMASLSLRWPPGVGIEAVREGVFHVQYYPGTGVRSDALEDKADCQGVDEAIEVIKQMCHRL